MLTERQDKYEEWIRVIAGSRLLYNTIKELETFMKTKSIESNGVASVYDKPEKLRWAFRDLKVEAQLMTDNSIQLDVLLDDYEKATKFYKLRFDRRKNLPKVARQLYSYYYGHPVQEKISDSYQKIFEEAIEKKIDVDLLALMLLGALPGNRSRDGDVIDIPQQWNTVMAFLDDFTRGCGGLFESLPVIEKAREEPNKTRLMLIHYTMSIMAVYDSYSQQSALHETTNSLKEIRVPLDLKGFWNERGGKADDTTFWQIEETIDGGVFFATWWQKAENEIIGKRYTWNLIENDDGSLTLYFLEPDGLRHIIEGKKLTKWDHAWYRGEKPKTLTPDKLDLKNDIIQYHEDGLSESEVRKKWKPELHLTRVKDQKLIATYEKWLDRCHIIMYNKDCQYVFKLKLWAVTYDAAYVVDDEDNNQIYMIPRDGDERFSQITLEDNVGILTMDGKRYMGFDESLLYIPMEEEELLKYGIRKIDIHEMI